MKPSILTGARAGVGQVEEYADARDNVARRGKPQKPVPQAKAKKTAKGRVYEITSPDGASYEATWQFDREPTAADLEGLKSKVKQTHTVAHEKFVGAEAGSASGVKAQAEPEKQMRLERNPNPGLLDYLRYGVQAIKEGFGEQVRGDLETVAELDKTIGKPLADGRKFVGDVAGTIVDPYMKAKPADQFSEGRAVSKGIQSLDPTQMLSAAKPLRDAMDAKGDGKASTPLMNGVMAWIANPVPGTVKFLSGVDDGTVQKAIAGDVGAMESLVGGALAFASNFVGAKTVKDAFASGNAKKISNVLDKASKVAVSRGDESVNVAAKQAPIKYGRIRGENTTTPAVQGSPLPDKAKGMGWRDPADVDPIVSFIRGESPNVTNVTADMPGVEFRTNTRMGEVTPGHREAARLTGKPLTTNDTAGLDMSMTMLDKAMRKLGLPDEQVRGTLAALNPILEQNPGAIFKVVDQIDPTGKLKQEFAAPFYSKLEQVAREKLPNRASPDQIRKTLIAAGVKPEEMQWTRMDDILSGEMVTKQDILDHLQENQVRVEEVMRGGPDTRGKRIDNASRVTLETTEQLRGMGYSQLDAANITLSPNTDAARRLLASGDTDAIEIAKRAWAANDDANAASVLKRDDTKFGQYTLPGGEDYRELLLTLPPKPKPEMQAAMEYYTHFVQRGGESPWRALSPEQQRAIADSMPSHARNAPDSDSVYRGSHWDEPNVLAHIRFDTRKGPNGEKILHVAEIQSDWHQKGRKEGYRTPLGDTTDIDARMLANRQERQRLIDQPNVDHARIEALSREHDLMRQGLQSDGVVPDAPFKKNWHELAMKRVMRYAAENDFDRVSWDTGITNADRYDLSKQVSEIIVSKADNGKYVVDGVTKDGSPFPKLEATDDPNKLADMIGKELAEKAVRDLETRSTTRYAGDDLKVGGEGMKGFYDKMLPDTANKMGKRFGAKVEGARIPDGEIRTTVGQLTNERPISVDDAARAISNGETVWVKTRAERGHNYSRIINPKLVRYQGRNVEFVTGEAEFGVPAHSIAITPEMRASLLNEGQPLFQRGANAVKGSFDPKARVIELAQGKADVSTVIHEVAHDWHGFLKDHPEHGAIIRKHYGDMTDEAGAEAFARHFERFLMTGKSPVAGLQRVFEAVRDWMKQIYTKWTHGKAPAEVEAIFKKAYQNPSERTMKLAREFEEAIGKKGQPDPLAPDAMTAAKDPDFYTEGGGGGTKPPTEPPTAQWSGDPNAPKAKTGMDYAKEVSYIARGLKLGADVGALLRQGGEMLINDPVQWVKSAGTAFSKTDKAKLAKHYQLLEERSIHGNKMADLRKKAGLKTSAADKEEAFASKLFDKVPGLNRLENFQKAFLDSGRIERFDSFYRKFPDATEKELRDYAAYLNSAMGKSNVSRVPEALEVVMTSPRWTASRWEMAGRIMRTPEKWVRGALGNKAAKQEARNLGRYAVAMYGMLKVAESQGAQIEFDPRSSDFLKMRMGEKVFDPTSGVAMPIRTALRMMLYARGEDAGFGNSAGIELAKTAINTANPVITTPWGLITGKNLTGFELDEEERGAMLMLPLIANGAMESWKKDGPIGAMIQTGTEIVGINSLRYPKKPHNWKPRSEAKGDTPMDTERLRTGTKVQQLLDKIPL